MTKTARFSGEDLSRWKREINASISIGKRVPLRRENSEYVAICPFHPDKNPSFKVYKMDEGVWAFKCFGCGKNGNVFQFVQKFDSVSFTDAVAKVLDEAGVEGWQDGQTQDNTNVPEVKPKEKEIFSFAQYAPAVASLEWSTEAQTWLAKRGISMATARKFALGFVQDATLVVGTSHPWAASGWVTFPTLSVDRQTVTAVKYRSLVAKKKKIEGKDIVGIRCISSPSLFNLPAVKSDDDVWIVEGEPDTLVLAQAGFIAVGYPSASYVPTDEECEILSKSKRRFLAGDTDEPGIKAMAVLQKRLRGATFAIPWPNNRKDANDTLTNECGNNTDEFKALVFDLQDRLTQKETKTILRNGKDILPKRIKWLWENKIPLGKITLFAGNPDNGKSLASTSVAAICTYGGTFPECNFSHEPYDVLMMVGEDDLEDTAVPRLMAAGADMSRIHFLEAVRPAKEDNREVRLDFDIPAIERQLESNPNIRLMIIDPISNYLGDVSMVAEQEVRSIMVPLKRAAEKFNIAIVIVMHLNKKNDLDAISRVGGAMAFIGVARCSWLFTRNVQKIEESEDVTHQEKKPDTFSMLRIKNNLVSASRAGIAYSVSVRHIPLNGEPEPMITPYITWGEVIEGSADDALGSSTGRRQSDPDPNRGVGRPNDKLQKAITWLEDTLQDNMPKAVKILRQDAKEAINASPETLDRAYEAIPGHTKPFKSGKFWYWQVAPMDETKGDDEEPPAQSDFLKIEGAE